MISLTLGNLYAIVLISLLLGGTLVHYGPGFLAWTDARRRVGDDEIDEYRATWAELDRAELDRAES